KVTGLHFRRCDMRQWIFMLSLGLFSLGMTASQCSAQETVSDRATGKSFPKTISFQVEGKEHILEATGVATRKKFFVKVYSIASYIEKPVEGSGDKFAQILDSKKAKQLTSIWVRNVEQKKVRDGYSESFNSAVPSGQLSALKPDLDKFLSFFGDVKANDKHALRWLPDGTLEVYRSEEHT